MSLEENYRAVENKIQAACVAAGRRREEIKLVAITKTRTAEEINALLPLGVSVIGENKVQEFVDKFPAILNDFDMQFVGQLQTNKVKYIIDKVSLIQSLDRVELAHEIHKRALQIGKTMDCLIEVNIGSETSKAGIAPTKEALAEFYEILSGLSGIRIRGLMTVAPQTDEILVQRKAFGEMFKLYEQLKTFAGNDSDINILSMGMTNDYEQAIAEGSTMIRLGTALFGKRNYVI